MSLIKIRDLKISFKESNSKMLDVIRRIDLDIERGKVYGFIGESGSGKTITSKTLLNANSGAIVTANNFEMFGKSFLDEKSITKDKKKWTSIIGKKVSYIPQDSYSSLNPTLKIKDQMIDAMKEHGILNTKEERLEKVIELLEKFGVEDAINKINLYPDSFSGGMRQRLLIAMMVAIESEVLIADEPVTALDNRVQKEILDLFEYIVKEFNISIILISHDISIVSKICDYIYIFYAGKIVEKGTRYEIFSDPKHPYLWSLFSSIPEFVPRGEKLLSIRGMPPTFDNLPKGDPFSVRNDYAIEIDFIKEPPLFKVTKTHWAATWLLHKEAPQIEPPNIVKNIIKTTKGK